MSGFKNFADGNVLTGDELDGYLMRQSAMRFPTTSDLTSNLASGIRETGMMAWADDTATLYMWSGGSWNPMLSLEKSTSVAFTAGGTNVTTGNATVNSKWRLSGGQVHWRYSFTVGSTSNLQSGAWAWGLPTATHSDDANGPLGWLSVYDLSATTMYTRAIVNSNALNCFAVDLSGVRWQTSTVALAAGDIISMNLIYRPGTGLFL